MSVHLILGGARSGKSSYAERCVIDSATAANGATRHYVATAESIDEEMQKRIAYHQAGRDKGWVLHECPLELSPLLAKFGAKDYVLVDCLTLWLNNVLHNQGEPISDTVVNTVLEDACVALAASEAKWVLVANEVGLGVVPGTPISRRFVDHAGRLNQCIAGFAQRVDFCVAGLVWPLKHE